MIYTVKIQPCPEMPHNCNRNDFIGALVAKMQPRLRGNESENGIQEVSYFADDPDSGMRKNREEDSNPCCLPDHVFRSVCDPSCDRADDENTGQQICRDR